MRSEYRVSYAQKTSLGSSAHCESIGEPDSSGKGPISWYPLATLMKELDPQLARAETNDYQWSISELPLV